MFSFLAKKTSVKNTEKLYTKNGLNTHKDCNMPRDNGKQNSTSIDKFKYQIPDQILFAKGMTIEAIQIYGIILRFTVSNQQSYFSNAYLSNKIGVSISTVSRAIALLEQLNLISRNAGKITLRNKNNTKEATKRIFKLLDQQSILCKPKSEAKPKHVDKDVHKPLTNTPEIVKSDKLTLVKSDIHNNYNFNKLSYNCSSVLATEIETSAFTTNLYKNKLIKSGSARLTKANQQIPFKRSLTMSERLIKFGGIRLHTQFNSKANSVSTPEKISSQDANLEVTGIVNS